MDKDQAKLAVQKLVNKYEEVLKSGTKNKYTEEETKKGFIVPLFAALGWDMEEKTDVSAEEHISGDRVDYGFYINGRPKFYLEAKPLKADLNDAKYARQAIKYSWNKGVTWAVLTDFENIKVFNADFQSEELAHSKFFEISYDKYLDDFDRLWLLSKKSFEDGEIDRKAEEWGKALKRVSITDALYKDLTECRKLLTDSLKRWNEKVSEDLLDEGVQKLLNRLVFIRVLEDRNIEPHILKNIVREWEAGNYEKSRPPLYLSLIKKFRELDEDYNSNLFDKHAFETWEEHDNYTKKVIDILYGKSGYYEYDFKIMPADILGAVYENYLGYKLEQLKKNSKVGQDSKKRKEHGIYYTPEFIVDYIIKNALWPVLRQCRTIDDLMKVKVLDPACGSGSFLIKAVAAIYQRYHEMSYRGSPTYKKIQIITQNIYGVDLDQQAVEIARLNLLINAVEEKVLLPSLAKNIRQKNSLTLNWQEEFPDVFKQGGFDVIIGNPPYIKEFVSKDAFDGLHNSPYYQGKMDLWTMFGCVSIDLLKDRGMVGFIAPNNWVSNAGASIFRDKILREGELKIFIDFGDYKIFADAGIQTMVYIYKKQKPEKKYTIEYLRISDKNIEEGKLITRIHEKKQKIEIEPEKLIGKNITFADSESGSVFDKLESKKNFELNDKEVGQGIVAAPDKYFLESDIGSYNKNEQNFLKVFYTSAGRFKSGESENHIFYLCDKNFGDKKIGDYPNIEKHFKPFEKQLKEAKEKYGTPDKPYYYLHRERNEDFFKHGPKIVCGVRVAYPSFFFTEESYYGSRALNFIKTNRVNLKYLTGILNSRISFFWLKNKGKQLGDLLQIDKGPLLGIPIYVGDGKQQKIIINLVDKMLGLNEELIESTENSDQWDKVKDEIAKTDQKIDEEVYKLYGLTPEEIKIVEENIKN